MLAANAERQSVRIGKERFDEEALPALRAEFRHDPAGSAVVAKLQAAVVPAVQYVGAKMTAEG